MVPSKRNYNGVTLRDRGSNTTCLYSGKDRKYANLSMMATHAAVTRIPARAENAEHKLYMDNSTTASFDDLHTVAKHQLDSNTSQATPYYEKNTKLQIFFDHAASTVPHRSISVCTLCGKEPSHTLGFQPSFIPVMMFISFTQGTRSSGSQNSC